MIMILYILLVPYLVRALRVDNLTPTGCNPHLARVQATATPRTPGNSPAPPVSRLRLHLTPTSLVCRLRLHTGPD